MNGKKALKTALKVSAAAAGTVLAAGAAVYEGALNRKLNAFFIRKFDKPDEEQTALYAGENRADAQTWFTENKGEDRTLTTEKTGRIHAYVIPAETDSHKWAVLCHGYNGAPEGTAVYAVHYHALGYHCVSPAMRGWGNDETAYCSMGWRDQDICRAWIDWIVAMDPGAQIVLHGYSMGAVTVMLATGKDLPENVKAAACDCGFTACEAQFRHVIGSFTGLPAFPLLNAVSLIAKLRGNLDVKRNRPIDAVARSKTPTIFLHGTADDFVPYPMMRELYDACAAPKTMQPIEGGQHASSVMKDPDTYWRAVDAFLDAYVS